GGGGGGGGGGGRLARRRRPPAGSLPLARPGAGSARRVAAPAVDVGVLRGPRRRSPRAPATARSLRLLRAPLSLRGPDGSRRPRRRPRVCALSARGRRPPRVGEHGGGPQAAPRDPVGRRASALAGSRPRGRGDLHRRRHGRPAGRSDPPLVAIYRADAAIALTRGRAGAGQAVAVTVLS